MNEKIFKKVTKYGRLKVQGEDFWLLNPQPLSKDSWQTDNQQAWLVTHTSNIEALDIAKDQRHLIPGYDQPFMIVCSFPLVIFDKVSEIWVWNGQYLDEIETKPEDQEPSAEDISWAQLNLFVEA